MAEGSGAGGHPSVKGVRPQLPKRLSERQAIFLSGLFSGVCQAGIFNPYDRALYLSIKDSRPFLNHANWTSPFTGLSQSLLGRTLSGGMYFPLFDIFKPFYIKELKLEQDSLLLSFLAGNSAGAVNGVVLNGLTAIKYQTWESGTSLLITARHMAKKGGVKPFLKGMNATVTRDTVFGGTFGFLQHLIFTKLNATTTTTTTTATTSKSSKLKFIASMISGAVATIVSSPFNYVRTMQYATPPGQQPPSTPACLRGLLRDARNSPSPLLFIQQRFRVGWGTFRVAIGMALGWELYESCKWALDSVR